jgi:hypothetical protein
MEVLMELSHHSNLPEGITYDSRARNPYLARYGSAGQYRKYCATIEEAVDWLEKSRGTTEVWAKIKQIRPQLPNHDRQLESMIFKVTEISSRLAPFVDSLRGENKQIILSRLESIDNVCENLKEEITVLQSVLTEIINN